MRKASKVLGFIGGIMAVVFAIIIMLLFGFLFAFAAEDADTVYYHGYEMGYFQDSAVSGGLFGFIVGFIPLVGGVLGIIGAAIVNEKNVAVGVSMLIGCFLILITPLGYISFVLLLLGGVFALMKEPKQSDTPQQQVKVE